MSEEWKREVVRLNADRALKIQLGQVNRELARISSLLADRGNSPQTRRNDAKQLIDEAEQAERQATSQDRWELDEAIDLLAQDDRSGLEDFNRSPDRPTEGEQAQSLEALRRQRDELQSSASREESAAQTEQRNAATAQGDAATARPKATVRIPADWVQCTCPPSHPGAGVKVNGVRTIRHFFFVPRQVLGPRELLVPYFKS